MKRVKHMSILIVKISSSDGRALDTAVAKIVTAVAGDKNCSPRIETLPVVNDKTGKRILGRKLFFKNPTQKNITILTKIDVTHEVTISIS